MDENLFEATYALAEQIYVSMHARVALRSEVDAKHYADVAFRNANYLVAAAKKERQRLEVDSESVPN